MRLARPEQRGPEGTPNGPVGRKSNAALEQGLIGRAALAVTLAVCASFVASSTSVAAATKTVSFIGHYKGDASLLINNGSVTISSVAGKGTGTLFGASTVLGKGSASSTAQCDPFTGTGSISGASGKLDLRVTESKSSGCSSGQSGACNGHFSRRRSSYRRERQRQGCQRQPQVQWHPQARKHERLSKRPLHSDPQRETDGQGLAQ